MSSQLDLLVQEYLATLERNIEGLKSSIKEIDSYGENLPDNLFMVEQVHDILLTIKVKQKIMSQQLQETFAKLAELEYKLQRESNE